MISITKETRKVLDILNKAGYEAYMVGGAVRGALMGIKADDIDITTNAVPQKVKELFSRYKVIETGIKHGTVTVIVDKEKFEITTYRKENEYSDNRHPDNVEFTDSLKEDCARRDFTMNAVCYNPNCGFKDFYSGEDDINKKIIRCVGDPDKRMKEDALRILRAVRFVSTLGFEMEESTKKAVFENKNLLNNIAPERICEELKKLLCGDNIKNTMLEYVDVISVVIPHVKEMEHFDQRNPHHVYDVLTHTAIVMENTPPEPRLRMAALLHDMAKPKVFRLDSKGIGHFHHHAEAGAEYADEVSEKLRLSNEDKKFLRDIVLYHDDLIEPNEKAVRKALNKFGEPFLRQLLIIKRADNKGQNTADYDRTQEYDNLEKMIDYVVENDKAFSLRQLKINGNDLEKIGIKPSCETGKILNELLDMVIDGYVDNDTEKLLEKAKGLHNKTML